MDPTGTASLANPVPTLVARDGMAFAYNLQTAGVCPKTKKP